MKFVKKLLSKFKELPKIKKVFVVVMAFFVGIFIYSTSIVLIDTIFATDISKTLNNEQYQLEQKEKAEQKKLEKEAKKLAKKEQEEKEKVEKEKEEKEAKEKAKKEKLEKEEEKKKSEKEENKSENTSKDKEQQKPADKKVTMVKAFVNIDNKITIDEAKKLLSEYGEVIEYTGEVENLEGDKYTSTELTVVKKNKNAILLTFRNEELSRKVYLVDLDNPATKDWAYVNYKTSLGGYDDYGIWDSDDTKKNLAKGKSIKEFNKMVLKFYNI